jgi:hypothetical protein
MTKEEMKYWHTITKDFEEIKPLLVEHKQAQQKMRKVDRKIKTINAKYAFMSEVVGVNSDDTVLGNAIKLLLKNAGFTKVVHFKSKRIKPQREDLQAWEGNDLFVIEAKGISKENPSHPDSTQVLKYMKETEKRVTDKKVYGITIINHSKQLHVSNRRQTFRDNEREKDVANFGIGYMSTYDLLIGFWHLKMGRITFEQFKDSLKQIGLITYDSKGGKTSKK